MKTNLAYESENPVKWIILFAFDKRITVISHICNTVFYTFKHSHIIRMEVKRCK